MKTYYLAKVLHKLRLSSFAACHIDKTARVDAECALTKVTLGRYSYVGSGTRITDAAIGNFCSVGGNCGIGGGIHPTEYVSSSPAFLKGKNILNKNFAQHAYAPSVSVEIGSDVWIGENVFIASGVKIGDGAVIGAHAVVTRDVAPYSIVAGVPAKELRKRFSAPVIEKLLAMKWWDCDDQTIERYAPLFDSPEKLIEAWEERETQ